MGIEVARLQAAFELLDEASPTIDAIEKAMGGLEDALGVTREAVKKNRDELEDLTKAGELTEKAVKALGITTEEYFRVLSNNQALAKAAEGMDRLQVSANQMNKAFNENTQRSGMAMAGMHEQALAMDKGMSDALQRSGMEMSRLHDEALAINKTFRSGTDDVTNFGIAIAGQVTAKVTEAAGKFKNFLVESTDLAVRLEMLENVSRKLGETQGYSAQQIDGLAAAIAKQGITSIKSREAINKMVQAGLDLGKATKLARLAQDAGTVGNINSSEALSRLIHGITTMQTETLRNVGININMQKAQQDYALSIGKTVKELSAQEKQQAAMNAVLKEGEKIHGSYETRMGTAGGAALSMARQQEEAMVKLGNAMKPLKELSIQMETLFWKNVQKFPEVWLALGAAVTAAGSVIALGMGSWSKGLDLLISKKKALVSITTSSAQNIANFASSGASAMATLGKAFLHPVDSLKQLGTAAVSAGAQIKTISTMNLSNLAGLAGGGVAGWATVAAGAAAVGVAVAAATDAMGDGAEAHRRASDAGLLHAENLIKYSHSENAAEKAIWDKLSAQEKADAQAKVTRANLEEATAAVGLFEGAMSLLTDVWEAASTPVDQLIEKWGLFGIAIKVVMAPIDLVKKGIEGIGWAIAEARQSFEWLGDWLYKTAPSAEQTAAMARDLAEASKVAGKEIKDWGEAQRILGEKSQAAIKVIQDKAAAEKKAADERSGASARYRAQIEQESGALLKKLQADEEAAKVKDKAASLSKKLGRVVTEEEVRALNAAEEASKKHEAAMKKSATAAETHTKKIKELASGLAAVGGGKAQKEMDDLAEALKEIGGVANVGVEQMDDLAQKVLKLEDAGGKATPEMHALAQGLRDAAAAKAEFDEQMAKREADRAMTGGIDLKKFYADKEALDRVAGADVFGNLPEDAGISAVGMIPEDQIKSMAEGFLKAAEQGEVLSRAQELVILRYEEIRAAEERAREEAILFGEAGQKTLNETEKRAAATAQKIQSITEGLLILGNAIGGTAGQLAQMLGTSMQGWQQYGEQVQKLNEAVSSGKMTQAEANAEKFKMKVNLVANAVGMLGSILDKSTNPSVQKLGGALQGAAAGAKLGSAFGPWGTAIGAVGGAIVGFIGKAKKMRAEMKKLNEEFIASHGGLDKLKEKAKQAGVDVEKAMKAKTPEQLKKQLEAVNKQLEAMDELLEMAGGSMEGLKAKAADAGVSLQEIWDAKTPEEYLAATEKVKKSLQDWDKANEKLNAAMDKYGITIDQLGPKFRQAGFDKMGMELFESFSLLKAAGVDVSIITEKMSADMSDYVNRAVAAGSTIPQAMKPMIDQMIANGDLLDENGEAYTSLEDAGITFAQTLEEGIASAVKAIEELVAVLAQGFNIPVNVHAGDGGGGGGNAGDRRTGNDVIDPVREDLGFAEGSGGFRNFGSGTLATLHGTEAVVTPPQMEGWFAKIAEKLRQQSGSAGGVNTVVNLAISENPMQTAETVEQMRKFTLETVEKEVSRSLADAIADGRA